VQSLRESLSAVTVQCAQLDEANRAWLQYHQNQLEAFRNKLQGCIPFEDELDLGQMAGKIVDHLDELRRNAQLGMENVNMSITAETCVLGSIIPDFDPIRPLEVS
jgi:hypothetical protein